METEKQNNDELVTITTEIAKELGFQDTIVQFELGYEWQIRYSNSAQDIFKRWEIEALDIFLVKDGRTTTLRLESPSISEIHSKLQASLKFLQNAPKSPFYHGIEEDIKPVSSIEGLYDSRIKTLHEQAPKLVQETIDSALNNGAKKVAGVFYFGYSDVELQTSKGFYGKYNNSYYRTTTRAFITPECSGQDVLCGRNLDKIAKQMTLSGEKAGQIANMAENPKQGKAGIYDVIMSPTVAGNVFGEITDSANPLLIMLGMSPLGDKLGKSIAPPEITVWSDGRNPEGIRSRPFDVEGTPTKKFPLIEEGKLVNLIHNTSTASQSQTHSTGNSDFVDIGLGPKLLAPIHLNLQYKAGDITEKEIIAESQHPTIYITSNWYTRFTNQLEGSFSTIPRDGLFYIENGEIQYPIRNVRLSDNLLRMFQNVSHISKDLKQIQWWEVVTPQFLPTFKIKDCHITAATK